MSEEELTSVTKLAPFTTAREVSRVTGLSYEIVVKVIAFLKDEGKITWDVRSRLNTTQCRELLETGGIKTVTRFFSPSHGSFWSLPELDFIRDNIGTMADYELAHWLGRTERAVRAKRLQLDLNHFDESGYFGTQDVMKCLNIRNHTLSRYKKAGKIRALEGSGVRKDIECDAGKLRYHLKELTKDGKEVLSESFGSLFKGRKFLKDYYASDDVTEYIETYGEDRDYPCLICKKPSRNSSLCFTCR